LAANSIEREAGAAVFQGSLKLVSSLVSGDNACQPGQTLGIEFQILGPLEVRIDGVPVAIGGPRQRALLAMLLLSANRAVSRDRLIDELLDGAPSKDAERTLRVQVSRLRGVLDANGDDGPRLVARPPGYLLRVEPGELDLERFEALLAEGHRAFDAGDFERASRVLREADSLWRGRPLADLEFERFARIDIERLQELRLEAVEQRIDAELALGRHSMLIAELDGLVAEHPLRERPRGQLMLALYRSGRQAEALETYRAGRSLLSEELALEPSPSLRELEQSILRQEPALDLTVAESGAVATKSVAAVAAATPEPAIVGPVGRAPSAVRARRAVTAAIVLAAAAAAVVVTLLATRGSRSLTATANSVAMIDASSGRLRAVVPAGGQPGGIATGAGAVWETDTANDLLLAINPSTRIIERIPVGRGPTGVAVGDGEVWVVNQLDRRVSEINPHALALVGSFSVGTGASSAAFGDGSLWVANTIDDSVSRINPSTGKVSTIPLAGQPAGIAVGREGIWVADHSTDQLLLIDPRSDQVTEAQEIGGAPTGVAIGANSVWVTNTAERTVSRFDPNSGSVTKINVGEAPVGIAYGAGAAWAADSLDGTVARIDPQSDSAHLARVGGAPTALAVLAKQIWTAVLPGPATHVGGTLTIAERALYGSIGNSVDPAQFAGLSQWQMLSMTNDGLVTYRRASGLSGSTLVPDLATSLPIPTDGGRTYTFELRRGIRYSNGAPVEPEDFRHEIERVFALGNGYPQSFYTGIVGAQACMSKPSRCSFARGIIADDAANTVTFHLAAPDPDFLYKLAFPWADAVPADTPDRPLGRSTPPATGPYMTKSISLGRGTGRFEHPLAFGTWTLVRNPHFREWSTDAQPSGYPDKIVLSQTSDPHRAVSDVEQGTLDVLLPAPTNRLSELAAHYTQQFHSEPLGATFALAMNTHAAPFNSVLVRRALNFAIDRGRITSIVGGPLAAQPTCQILPPDMAGYQPYCPYTLKPSARGSWTGPSLANAKELVRTSGTRGMNVTLLVPPPDPTNPTTKIGRYLLAVLEQLGYHPSLRTAPSETSYYQTMGDSRSRAQIGWFTWAQDYPAPSDFIVPLLTCGAFQPRSQSNLNDAEFCDQRIDNAVQRAEALEPNAPGSANEAWAAIDKRITNEAPWLSLYNPRLDIAVSSRVGNFEYHPFFGLLFDQLWVR
jgi:ABC-type transport system substrate-binding protein/DNA-binding SARP family transcriptional activator/DNA-binding beta-propeller fold protein YncE